MNLSNLSILFFALIASTSAAALLTGIDEDEIAQQQVESLPVEEPKTDVFTEDISKVNKRSSLKGRSHWHGVLGRRRHSYHRHRYHPHRNSGSYLNRNNQMNSPTDYTDASRFFSRLHMHRQNHFNNHHHHEHGHRLFCNHRYHQVSPTTDAPLNQETTTAKDNRSREELIDSIFNSNNSNTWENVLEPITDSPVKSTTNSKGLLYDIDLRRSY